MIWCVEDEVNIREMELYALNSVGFKTRGLRDGSELLSALAAAGGADASGTGAANSAGLPALIILDVMLPGMDGMEILTRLKESDDYRDIPVIMVTAKGQEYDKLRGLDLGADDYIVKPFSIMEMISRVKAVLRRCNPRDKENLIMEKGLTVNVEERLVKVEGKRVHLTYKEFEILRLFMARPGMIYTREQLFAQVWNCEYPEDSRTLDNHIRTLRHKLGPWGKGIETVRNVGYRWETEEKNPS